MRERRRPWIAAAALCALAATSPVAAQNGGRTGAGVILEAAIQKETVEGDLRGAISLYNTILSRHTNERAVVARALWHLGQSYEKLGNPQARQVYERLLREHADQRSLVSSARKRLTALTERPTSLEPSEAVVRDVASRPSAPVPSGNAGNGNLVVFSDLAVHNLNTGESRRLTSGSRSSAYPVVWGQRVAYFSWSGDLQETLRQVRDGHGTVRSPAELRVVNLDGSGDRLILRAEGVPWLRPFAWSPDGRQILAVFEQADGSREIRLVSVTDGGSRVLKSLAWETPQSMSFSPDGAFVSYQVASPRNSRQLEMFVIPVDGSARPAERRYAMALGSQAGAATSNTQQVVHVLNRLGFGPRPGDIERVRAMGIENYIEEQLHPERIKDPVVDEKLASFTSLRMSVPELLAGGPVSPVAARRRATIFERRDAGERAAQGAALPLASAPLPASDAARRAAFGGRPRDYEIHAARFTRALYSERQLFEVMVDFWMNHFNVNHGDHPLTANFEEDAIRRHAMGRFEDMLFAVARHPRMLFYLDNWKSSAPADVVQKRVAEARAKATTAGQVALLSRMPFLEAAKGLNENFARELMELHTLGVNGGYTQADILEVAKILTGWTISGAGIVNGREDDGAYVFDPLLHVDGDKTVLGRRIAGGGVEEGEQLLKMLAHHPSTARFIATKLARRFVSDDPPADVIDAGSRAFEATGGDIRAVLASIFASPRFRSAGVHRAKIKKPFELVVSSLRALGAEVGFNTQGFGTAGNNTIIQRMGERVYNHEAPDGNPDVGAAWMNSNALLVRLEFANALATGRLGGVKLGDLRAAQTLLEQFGVPRPTPAQVQQTRAMLQAARPSGSPGGQQMMMAAGAGGAGAAAAIDPAAVVVATMLGSPQFQKR